MKSIHAVAMLKVRSGNGHKYYFMVEDGVVLGWPSVNKALKYFEDGYKKARFSGDLQRSASSIMYDMTYSPSIIGFKSQKEIEDLVNLPQPIVSLASQCGFEWGIECNSKAAEVWKKGSKPRG